MSQYWNYYRDDFDWNDDGEILRSEVLDSAEDFLKIGCNLEDAAAAAASGYVILENYGVVIDRYYGGPLSSIDGRTRFFIDDFKSLQFCSNSHLSVIHARSFYELQTLIQAFSERYRLPLLMRGQLQHYTLPRKLPNPHFVVPSIGEISLLPSLWRCMQEMRPKSLHSFTNLSLLEWSKIIYSQFDLVEVSKRAKNYSRQGFPMSYSDMEECDDPMLQQFGCTALDLNIPERGLTDLLTTLLQHYGLRTPYLDLTTEMNVALFFATHQYDATKDQYEFVGTGAGKSVLYLFRQNGQEMVPHADHRLLGNLQPLRPQRQACVICRTSPFAMNLAADFLVGVIQLDFDLGRPTATVDELFPPDDEDSFLSTLKRHLLQPERVAEFRGRDVEVRAWRT